MTLDFNSSFFKHVWDNQPRSSPWSVLSRSYAHYWKCEQLCSSQSCFTSHTQLDVFIVCSSWEGVATFAPTLTLNDPWNVSCSNLLSHRWTDCRCLCQELRCAHYNCRVDLSVSCAFKLSHRRSPSILRGQSQTRGFFRTSSVVPFLIIQSCLLTNSQARKELYGFGKNWPLYSRTPWGTHVTVSLWFFLYLSFILGKYSPLFASFSHSFSVKPPTSAVTLTKVIL